MHHFSLFLLIISGLSAGFVTAAAYVAFIAMLGIFPKFAEKTRTASNCILYENCLIIGILLATFLQFFSSYASANIVEPPLPPSWLGLMILLFIGLFGGIYIGFLIGGLSEVLNVIPIYSRATHIKKQVQYIVISLAFGKGVFIILQYCILKI